MIVCTSSPVFARTRNRLRLKSLCSHAPIWALFSRPVSEGAVGGRLFVLF